VRTNKLPWTAENNESLKAMVAQGASVVRGAGAFNRSTIAVRNQARKLGGPFPNYRIVRKKWAEVSPGETRHR
jgi:hypothetical protein